MTFPEPQNKFDDHHLSQMTDTNQKQLGNTLWTTADQLRVAMDAEATVKESLTVQIENSRDVLRTDLHPTYS